MRHAMAAEWTKLWSVRSTWWCLAGTAALMVVGAVTVGAGLATDLVREGRPAELPAGQAAVSALTFAQFALVTLAMLAITSEYASGTIRGTLMSVPVRGRLLAAKALVVGPVMFVAGALSGLLGAAVTHAVLSSTPVFGGVSTLPPGATAADVLRLGVVCALISLMTLGVALALRSAAGTLTVVFLLLLGLPLMLLMTGSELSMRISMRMPMFAGLAFMGSQENLTGGPIPYSAGEGLAWLLVWAGAGLAAGYGVLRRRDA